MHLPSEQPEEAGMGHPQHKEQCDQCKQHSDDNIHLVHCQRKMVVHLFFRIHKVFVAVVQQVLFSFLKVCLLVCQLRLFLRQLCFPGRKGSFPAGKLSLALFGRLFFLCHNVPPDGVFIIIPHKCR